MQGSVTVHMKASPETVWSIVTDVTRIGEFSPETFEGEWVGDATGPAIGAKFRGHVKRNGIGPIYWTVCKVTSCVQDQDFGYDVVFGDKDQAINSWRYLLAPRDGGTDVTESFSLAPSIGTRLYWAVAGWRRGPRNERGMRQTLERIRAVAEST
jgi:hypothetical protein